MRKVLFFRTQNGESPIENFLDGLSSKQAKKVTWVLQLIESMEMVPVQYFKKLVGSDDIWEAKINFGGSTFRLLGFLENGNLVVLTNGFSKKTQKTPNSQIKLAEQRKKDYKIRKKTK